MNRIFASLTGLALVGVVALSAAPAQAAGGGVWWDQIVCGPSQQVKIVVNNSGGRVDAAWMQWAGVGPIISASQTGSGWKTFYTGLRTLQYYEVGSTGTIYSYDHACV